MKYSMCIKDIKLECLVFYSYLSKDRRRGGEGGVVLWGVGNVNEGQGETLG